MAEPDNTEAFAQHAREYDDENPSILDSLERLQQRVEALAHQQGQERQHEQGVER